MADDLSGGFARVDQRGDGAFTVIARKPTSLGAVPAAVAQIAGVAVNASVNVHLDETCRTQAAPE